VSGSGWYAPETVGAGGGVQALFWGVVSGGLGAQVVPSQPMVPGPEFVIPQAFGAVVNWQVEPELLAQHICVLQDCV